jgi:3-oxoacyl-[acyl-carrier protein] reductase
MRSEKPVALITGASGGIGTALVERFAADGYLVVALSKNVERLSTNGNIVRASCDVTNAAASRSAINSIMTTFGRLDVAVNNAGILKDSLLGMLDDDTLDNVLETNTASVIRYMRDESRLMMRVKKGVIINVASVVGMDGNSGQVAYSASKAGVIGATKSAAQELANFGIRVNAVAPGLIDTKMLRSVKAEKLALMQARVPLKRLGTPEDVANAIAFLASEQASYITGQVLRIDGGFTV